MNAPIDVTNVRIETDRLILRAWQESDLADFYEYASVPGVGEKAGWNHHQSVDESKRILGFFIAGKKTFALVLKENGKVIGSLGLEPRADDAGLDAELQGREIGYVLSKDYWGRGLMTEAVKAVIDYCFSELSYDYLTCGHFDHNDRSRRVVEKCGFEFLKNVVTPTVRGIDEPGKLYVLYNPRRLMEWMTAPFDVTEHRIETPRLLLRPWQKTDLEDFHEYATDEAVAGPAGWLASKTLEMSKEHLDKYLQRKEAFAIVLKDSGKVIGSICLQPRYWPGYPIDRQLQGREFGFDLSRAYWGRGLVPEAVNAVIDYCFNVLKFDFLSCGYFLGNDQSARVVEKCGFSFLFDRTQTIPSGRTEEIRTCIRYNSNK